MAKNRHSDVSRWQNVKFSILQFSVIIDENVHYALNLPVELEPRFFICIDKQGLSEY